MLTIFFLLATQALAANDERVLRDSGVILHVKKMPDDLEGYRLFFVTAKNRNGDKRTLSAKIYLYQQKHFAGECTLHMSLGGGSEQRLNKQCKESAPSDSWEVEIIKIYDF